MRKNILLGMLLISATTAFAQVVPEQEVKMKKGLPPEVKVAMDECHKLGKEEFEKCMESKGFKKPNKPHHKDHKEMDKVEKNNKDLK